MKFNKIIAVGLVVVGFGRWCYGGGQIPDDLAGQMILNVDDTLGFSNRNYCSAWESPNYVVNIPIESRVVVLGDGRICVVHDTGNVGQPLRGWFWPKQSADDFFDIPLGVEIDPPPTAHGNLILFRDWTDHTVVAVNPDTSAFEILGDWPWDWQFIVSNGRHLIAYRLVYAWECDERVHEVRRIDGDTMEIGDSLFLDHVSPCLQPQDVTSVGVYRGDLFMAVGDDEVYQLQPDVGGFGPEWGVNGHDIWSLAFQNDAAPLSADLNCDGVVAVEGSAHAHWSVGDVYGPCRCR